jgi:hypothetical protein
LGGRGTVQISGFLFQAFWFETRLPKARKTGLESWILNIEFWTLNLKSIPPLGARGTVQISSFRLLKSRIYPCQRHESQVWNLESWTLNLES